MSKLPTVYPRITLRVGFISWIYFLYSWQVAGTRDPPENLAWVPGRMKYPKSTPLVVTLLDLPRVYDKDYIIDGYTRLSNVGGQDLIRVEKKEHVDKCKTSNFLFQSYKKQEQT